MTDGRTLGILGGMGPMSTAYFYEMIIDHTAVECDQDHIDIVINSRATTPDRTHFIMTGEGENPGEYMARDAKKLEKFGAQIIAIPCNTAHYFYDMVNKEIGIPVLNIIYETVSYLRDIGAEKVGIMATDGTVSTETYQKTCTELGVDFAIPDKEYQKMLMEIIYDDIKLGKATDIEKFKRVSKHLADKGCDRLILGCTELSLIKKAEKLGSEYVDSLEVLAYKTILACGKKTCGFEGLLK